MAMVSADETPPPVLTPEAFELTVKSMLDMQGVELADYQSSHREVIAAHDGEYEFDITIRFSALSVSYLTLIECKHYGRRLEREKVLSLWAKIQSVRAHKGIIFATGGYQSGAIAFAEAHGIGLVHVADGRSSYLAKAHTPSGGLIAWENVPDYIAPIVGWSIEGNAQSLLSERDKRRLSLIDCSVVQD